MEFVEHLSETSETLLPFISTIIITLNNDIESYPKLGTFTLEQFIHEPELIKNSQRSKGLDVDIVDEVLILLKQSLDIFNQIEQSSLCEDDLSDQNDIIHERINILRKEIPNPIIDESMDRTFWTKIYNLLLCKMIFDVKCSKTFVHEFIEYFNGDLPIPESISLNQLNQALYNLNVNFDFDFDPECKKFINMYDYCYNNEKKFSRTLLCNIYIVDNIFAGLTHNIETVIRKYSQPVQNVILMHIIISNGLYANNIFITDYNANSKESLLQEIEYTEEWNNIVTFNDVFDLCIFQNHTDISLLTYTNDKIVKDFIENNIYRV